MNTKRYIKWHDQQLTFDSIKNSLVEKEELQEEYEDEYDDDGPSVRLVQTAFGTMEVNDKYHPLKHLKMWMGHTNFNISNTVIFKIKQIPGVEILKPITRYRFYLGVGECFEFENVRREIQAQVCDSDAQALSRICDKTTKDKVKSIINLIDKNNKWAVYVLPNGEVQYSTDEKPDFDEKFKLYQESEKLSKGILISKENLVY